MNLMDLPLLTPANVYSLFGTPPVKQALKTFKTHKIIVDFDEKRDVDTIFDLIFLHVGNSDFCPTNVNTEIDHLTFCVQKCRLSIEKLCKLGLVIRDGFKAFHIKIQLCYKLASNVDNIPSQYMQQVFEKRITNSIISLEGIANELLLKHIYISTRNLICLSSYLQQCFTNNPLLSTSKITTIKLCNSGIKCLEGIKGFFIFNNLSSLNLRNNSLQDTKDLEPLKTLNLKDLWLDGNPLCQKFPNERLYIEEAKMYCRNLIKLDGILLKFGLPQPRRNFVCDTNAVKLVDQFLEHYFTVFDICRRNLLELYDKNSLFSLSCAFLKSVLTQSSSASKYISVSRNIFKLSDISKGQDQLHRGADNICWFLNSLPRTQHDPYSFTTDIVQHSPLITIIMVTGMFRVFSEKRELDNTDSNVYYNFCRTFYIKNYGCNEYRILNETLYISNLMINCPKNFTISIPAKLSEYKTVFGEPNEEEKQELCKILSNLTQKTEQDCENYLKNTDWDIKNAINLFIKDYTSKSG